MTEFHPELQTLARFLPRFSFSPGLARFANTLVRIRGVPKPPVAPGVVIKDYFIPGAQGHSIRIRLYMPEGAAVLRPALLWMHGGGFIIGAPEQDETNNIFIVQTLQIVVAAVAYRLAPAHPFPAPMEDCYAALLWLHRKAAEFGIRQDGIAVGGQSAGGGLAAGLAIMAHDRQEVPIVFQMLIYPMLDDRTVTRTDIDISKLRLWTTKSNVYGWSCYLGTAPGGQEISPYAAPARRESLACLPPAWIGVGTFDLFHDEDVAYTQRLIAAGVHCELTIVEGAFHGFDAIRPATGVAREFRQSYVNALRKALCTKQEAAF